MDGFVFVTGNLKKVEYLEKFLGHPVEHHKLDLDEIQSVDRLEVTRRKAEEAYRQLSKPVLIEDTSLRFNALGKLPGTFIKFFLEEMGCEGICQMMQAFDDKSAIAAVTYGWYDGKEFYVFDAEVNGVVSDVPRGSHGMGWDPVFILDGTNKTYAEMPPKELEKYSVRKMAVEKLKKFLEE